MESQRIPGLVGGLAGGIHSGGFIQVEFIQEVGMVHGKGVRAQRSLIYSSCAYFYSF